ncbi:hypothetical protein [Sphingobium yanoikuyae]|uniref:hypothetical protein n=1 Tax=Sphingobium yanoikuyae TaxID=13690 RepID=UPI0035C82427
MNEPANASRSMTKEACILFFVAWATGVAAMLGRGQLAPIEGLGFGIPLFALGAIVLIARRSSESRLQSAVITIVILGAIAGYGLYYGATRT